MKKFIENHDPFGDEKRHQFKRAALFTVILSLFSGLLVGCFVKFFGFEVQLMTTLIGILLGWFSAFALVIAFNINWAHLPFHHKKIANLLKPKIIKRITQTAKNKN